MAITINGNGTITGINVGGLPDGIVDTDMIAANAVTSAKSSGLGGLSMHDNWYISSSLSPGSGTNFITANWTRNTNTEAGSIGSAMTESSGVFTFPSTGVYQIDFNGGFYVSDNPAVDYVGLNIHTTLDNANYSKRVESYQAVPAEYNNYVMCPIHYVFDVTNTTNCKVKLGTILQSAVGSLIDVGGRYGQVFFTKLGDT